MQKLKHWVNQQKTHPRGIFGLLVSEISSFFERRINELVIEALIPTANSNILEVGVGTGRRVQMIVESGCYNYILGTEASRTLARKATSRNLDSVLSGRVDIQFSFLKLPKSCVKFDRAMSVLDINYWHEPASILSQIVQMMEIGGLLVVVAEISGRCIESAEDPILKNYFSHEEMSLLLELAGLIVVDAIRIDEDAGITMYVTSKTAVHR